METTGLNPLFFDIALYAFFGYLGCLGFMSWYLKRSGRAIGEEPTRGFIWIELLLRYRDFTRTKFHKVHLVYHLAILLFFTIVGIFCAGIVVHARTLPTPLSFFVTVIGLLIFAIFLGLFFRLSRKTYYPEP